MAGLTLHLATLQKESFENIECIIGVIFPDIAKKAYKGDTTIPQEILQYVQYSTSGYDITRLISGDDLLNYSKNSHFTGAPKVTDTPSLMDFSQSSFVDLDEPFWKAVATHLIGDLLFYHPSSQCIHHEKFQAALTDAEKSGDPKGTKVWKQWYRDYDRINSRVVQELMQTYGINIMDYVTPEMQEQFKVNFIDEEPVYQNWDGIKNWIYKVRELTKQLNSKDDIERIINSISGRIPEDDEEER